jgi:hypothetical protein
MKFALSWSISRLELPGDWNTSVSSPSRPSGDAGFVMGRLQVEWDLIQSFMAEQSDVLVEPLDFTWGAEALPYKYRFTFQSETIGRPKGGFELKDFPLEHFPICDSVSFDIYLAEAYPVVKPEIYAVSDIWHPNVSPKDGFVCYVNDKTYTLTVHLTDIVDMLAGVLSWKDIYGNPDDFHRRVEIGDYLNPDAAGWAYGNPEQIEGFRTQYYEGGGIEFGDESIQLLTED